MKKLLALFLIGILFVLNTTVILPASAAVDNSKYIPTIICTDEGNKLMFDPDLAETARKMSEDTYNIIKSEKPTYYASRTLSSEGFVSIKQNFHGGTFLQNYLIADNFIVGVKSFEHNGKKKHVLAIAFRGSNDLGDWHANIIGAMSYEEFHMGFYAAAVEAQKALSGMFFTFEDGTTMSYHQYLAGAKFTDDYYILVTGHSLGGAIANILVGELLANEGIRHNAMCYTYASPLVCSKDKASQKNAYNIFNIINTKDTVPKIGYEVWNGARFGIDLKGSFSGNILTSDWETHDLKKSYYPVTKQVIDNIASTYKYAYVPITIPTFPVILDGYTLCNEYSQYPPIMYKDITYLPMTYGLARFMGLSTAYDSANKIFDIGINYNKIMEPFNISKGYDYYNAEPLSLKATIPNYTIRINGSKTIRDNHLLEYPILNYKDITYFPLTWEYAVDDFHWRYRFSSDEGLIISCTTDGPAVPQNIQSYVSVHFNNGEATVHDAFTFGNEIMIPMYSAYKYTWEDEGVTTYWEESVIDYQKERTASHMSGGDSFISFVEGIRTAIWGWSDGSCKAFPLDIPAMVVNGTFYIPLRAYSRMIDLNLNEYANYAEDSYPRTYDTDYSSRSEAIQTLQDGYYVIATMLDSNYVLDIENAGTSNCDNLQLWERNSTPAQTFEVTHLGNEYYRIVNINSGKAIDAAAGTEAGSNVVQYEIDNTSTQIWKIVPAVNGSYYIINKESSLYLDVTNACAISGNSVGMFYKNDLYDAQKWYFYKQ